MEETYGCNLINTKRDGREVTEFVGSIRTGEFQLNW